MDADHFTAVLEVMLARQPYRVFTIEQYGGRLLEIDHRGALMFLQGLALFRAPGGIAIMFDHGSVRSIVDALAADVPNGLHQ